MSLTSNYNQDDWLRLTLTIILKLVIPLSIFVYLVFSFVLPMLDVFTYFMDYITETESILDFWIYISETDYYGLESADGFYYTFLFLLLTFMGAVGISFWISWAIFTWSGKFFGWIADRKQIVPRMMIVIFWKGVPIQNTKWGKRLLR